MTCRLVNISITSTNWSIKWCKFTWYWTIFTMCWYIVTLSKMWQFNTYPTYLNSEHTFIKISTSISSTHCILISWTTVLAFTTRRSKTCNFFLVNSHSFIKLIISVSIKFHFYYSYYYWIIKKFSYNKKRS